MGVLPIPCKYGARSIFPSESSNEWNSLPRPREYGGASYARAGLSPGGTINKRAALDG